MSDRVQFRQCCRHNNNHSSNNNKSPPIFRATHQHPSLSATVKRNTFVSQSRRRFSGSRGSRMGYANAQPTRCWRRPRRHTSTTCWPSRLRPDRCALPALRCWPCHASLPRVLFTKGRKCSRTINKKITVGLWCNAAFGLRVRSTSYDRS